MCAICKDWQLGKLTIKEAWRNLNEAREVGFANDEDLYHYFEVAELLTKEENEKSKV
jgi:hypothetical protein